jgi:hypothetical protein
VGTIIYFRVYSRLDSQQEQLNLLQTAVASAAPVVSHPSPAEVGQGAIPKRSCAQEALLVDNVTLTDLRADWASMSRMVDSLDLGLHGNTTSTSFPKTLKRGWARPRGGGQCPPGHRTLLLATRTALFYHCLRMGQ